MKKIAAHRNYRLIKGASDIAQLITNNIEDEVEARPSKWHRMKMSKVVEEMDKNEFNSLSFEINDYRIRITKVEKND